MGDDSEPGRRRRRKRDPCSAHRSDGQPCQASAIPGGTVCRHHGGAAKQVRIRAERTVLLERVFEAWRELEKHDIGSERRYAAWDRLNAAERDLKQFDSDLDLIALMQMEITDPSGPEVRDWLLQAARDRLAGRPWTSPLRR